MKSTRISALVLGAGISAAAFSAVPTGAPSGSTGLCNDGSYSQSASKRGACTGHKGVKDWFGAAAAEPTTAAPTTATAAAMLKTAPTGAGQPAMAAAPGATPGSVWANEETKVYHCSGTKWYGKTQHGAYMSEADAKSKGFHGDHGKTCG